MKCPVDNATLLISERQGIEIDYCPECRGVWLDRGELDKLIERADDGDDDRRPRERDGREGRSDYSDHDARSRRPHKKKSFLSGIFESVGGGDD